jgi:hypothetical protein
MNPTRRTRSFCAPATSGHATAPPSPGMNSRRRIGHASSLYGSLSRPTIRGNQPKPSSAPMPQWPGSPRDARETGCQRVLRVCRWQTRRRTPSSFRHVRVAWYGVDSWMAILGTNRFSKLIDSYRLATTQPPPAGYILVHNHIQSVPRTRQSARGFRVWWATPGAEFVLCRCGWRPDLGQHYQVQRLGPVSRR